MERPAPLSTRSPNRPNPHPPSSILKRTLKTPSTIRKTNSATTISSSAANTFRVSSPGKSPARDWASTSLYDTAKTPKPRPISMIESGSKTVLRANPPTTIQRVQQMFDTPSQHPFETPTRPQQRQHQPPRADLLISFETPSQPVPPKQGPGTIPRSLLDLDLDDLLAPTPKPSSHQRASDHQLAAQISQALDREREEWIQEAETRHAADLEALAADLHTQYREKHTRKVDALKVTYKRQYEKKISALEERVRELEKVEEELKAELEKERAEKRELIEMSEELMRLTSGASEQAQV